MDMIVMMQVYYKNIDTFVDQQIKVLNEIECYLHGSVGTSWQELHG